MTEMEHLEQALKALREADGRRSAPEFTEMRLRAAFRRHHARPRLRWWASPWAWTSAAAATAIIIFAVARLVSPAAVQAPPAVAAKAPEPVAPPVPELRPAPRVAVSRPVRKRPLPAVPRNESRTSVTAARVRPDVEEFIAIPWAPPFTDRDRGQVVRVRVPRQSLRSMGLPVNEERIFDRIPADLLMGEDGVPRAIRFVNDRR